MVHIPEGLSTPSGCLGSISILCWIVVFSPQLYENYKNKSAKGLSLLFLTIWLVADISNLIGAIIHIQLPTVILLSIYYATVEIIMLIQYFYYDHMEYRQQLPYSQNNQDIIEDDEEEDDEEDSENEEDQLLNKSNSYDEINEKNSKKSYSLSNHLKRLSVFQYLLCISITSFSLFFLLLAIIFISCSYIKNEFIGDVFGYGSAVLYIGARVPQIMKNYKEKSTEGLQPLMFILSVIGNVTFTLSLILSDKSIRSNAPFIAGSAGTLIFDFILIAQVYIYRHHITPISLDI